MNVWKLFQKQTYNILSHRYYVACFIFLVFTTIISLVHLCEVWLNRVWSKEERIWLNNFVDNIGQKSLEGKLCQYMPIDVVYTWVNGSDPLFRSELLIYQRSMQKAITDTCPYSDCLPSHFTAIRILTGKDRKDESGPMMIVTNISTSVTQSWKLYSWDSPHAASEEVADKMSSNRVGRVTQAHWTSDGSILNIYSPKDVILFHAPAQFQNKISRGILTAWLGDWIRAYWLYPGVATVVVQLKTTASDLLQGKSWNVVNTNGVSLNLTEAHLLLEVPTKIKPSDYEPSRYDDKEELRYSLRSLERYAPWVRRIFLVTNGQVPHWLELEHPRLTFVTHSTIFPNLSHLPTFSSPAIETHLHRIPGLSQKFLYMNDDIILGDDVLPEDFITSRSGQKVYLSWPIPDCTRSCPWSWVGDGSCDAVCNISACAFDGGDCYDLSNNPKIDQFYVEHDWNHDYELDDGNKVRSKRGAPVAETGRDFTGIANGTEKCPTRNIVPRNGAVSVQRRRLRKKDCVDIFNCKLSKHIKYSDIDLTYSKCKAILRLIKGADSTRLKKVLIEGTLLKRFVNPYGRIRRSVANKSVDGSIDLQAVNKNDSSWLVEYVNARKQNHESAANSQQKDAAKARLKEIGKLYTYSINSARQLDTYAESLLHVNTLLNNRYGFKRRKVPAHMPHLVDKSIMAELQEKFKAEYEKTSSHRIRSPDDMQFAFSYFYYLMGEEVKLPIEEIFNMFDTDNTGTWSDREIRTVLTRLYPLPLQQSFVLQFEKFLLACSRNELPHERVAPDSSTPPYERYLGSVLPLVTKSMVSECGEIKVLLEESFGHRKRYPHTVLQHQESVGFHMVGSNLSDLLLTLDHIRQKPKKFICLNDNMDAKRTEDNEIVRAALIDFYHSLFPNPSQFELPAEYRNRFLYYNDYVAWKSHRSMVSTLITCAILLVGAFAFGCIFSAEVCWSLRKVKTLWRRSYLSRRRSQLYVESI